jgi:hypothetical protein
VADVFISCARADLDRVRLLAERLKSLGYSVYCDKSAPDTEAEIAAARAVIVAWSSDARNSTWVFAEAGRALDERKLLQVRLDAAQPPAPFDALSAIDISSDRAEWGPLEADIAALVRDGREIEANTPSVGLLATAGAAGAPKLVTIALATSLIAYSGALTAARNGVMSPEQLQLALTGMIGVAGASAALCMHRLVTIGRAGG